MFKYVEKNKPKKLIANVKDFDRFKDLREHFDNIKLYIRISNKLKKKGLGIVERSYLIPYLFPALKEERTTLESIGKIPAFLYKGHFEYFVKVLNAKKDAEILGKMIEAFKELRENDKTSFEVIREKIKNPEELFFYINAINMIRERGTTLHNLEKHSAIRGSFFIKNTKTYINLYLQERNMEIYLIDSLSISIKAATEIVEKVREEKKFMEFVKEAEHSLRGKKEDIERVVNFINTRKAQVDWREVGKIYSLLKFEGVERALERSFLTYLAFRKREQRRKNKLGRANFIEMLRSFSYLYREKQIEEIVGTIYSIFDRIKDVSVEKRNSFIRAIKELKISDVEFLERFSLHIHRISAANIKQHLEFTYEFIGEGKN